LEIIPIFATQNHRFGNKIQQNSDQNVYYSDHFEVLSVEASFMCNN